MYFSDLNDIDFKGGITLVAGSVEMISKVLNELSVELPTPDYYPKCLNKYLHRDIETTTVKAVRERVSKGEPLFAKPKLHWKKFTGKVFSRTNISELSSIESSESVLISSPVHFTDEFRVYVSNWELVAICQYTGEDDKEIDHCVVKEAIQLMKKNSFSSSTFAFDWGTLQGGELALVETNHCFAIGCYQGITPSEYFNFLASGWSQLTKRNHEKKNNSPH